jgi:hypothetical protein
MLFRALVGFQCSVESPVHNTRLEQKTLWRRFFISRYSTVVGAGFRDSCDLDNLITWSRMPRNVGMVGSFLFYLNILVDCCQWAALPSPPLSLLVT